MIEALEDGLVALLGSALPDIKVEPFPDDPDKYRLTHPHGAVLVGYGGGRFGKPYTLAGTAQEQRVEYQLVIKVRRLRSHVGAYGVLRAIRVALSNRNVQGVRFYPVREQFEDVSSGVWTYLAVYAADAPWVSQTQFPDDVAQALAAARIAVTGGIDPEPIIVEKRS